MAGLKETIVRLMEGRSEQPGMPGDPPVLSRLLASLRERVAPEYRIPAESFARELFDKAEPVLADAVDAAPLAGMVAGALAFLGQRGDTEVAVRVLVPSAERDGWSSPLTVVETVIEDRPFIVDTIKQAIEAEGGEIKLLLHPVFGVQRAVGGRLERIGPPEGTQAHESFIHAEVANLSPSAELRERLADRLRQLLRATRDYRAMREKLAALAADLRARRAPAGWGEDREELAEFLDWIGQKNFVYLGYREYDLRGLGVERSAAVRSGSGLGLLGDAARSSYSTQRVLPPALAARLDRPPLWLVSKTRAASPVHRAVPMDDISVKEVDAAGVVVGVRRLLGLFTAKADAEAASEVPILRRCLAAILDREGVAEDSHDGRDLLALFNSVPHIELLASHPPEIQLIMAAIRGADPSAGVRMMCRPDALNRGLFVVVMVPRKRFSTELYGRITAALRSGLRGTLLHDHVILDDRPIVRLHAYYAVPPEILARPPAAALQADLEKLLRTWDDELCDELARGGGRAEAQRLAARYAQLLPAAYKVGTTVAEAARDVGCLEALAASGRAQIELVAPARPGGPWALKLYLAREALVLSEFVPVLENLGLRVLAQDVVDLRPRAGGSVCIQTFAVESAVAGVDLGQRALLLVAALHALHAGETENDRLNALTLAAGIDWRAVDLLRGCVEYAHQLRVALRPTLVEALIANPQSAARLFAAFAAAFDPRVSTRSAAERITGPVAEARAEFLAGLDAVQSLAHDRALRALGEAVWATVRTNFYSAAPGAAIAVKFDCARLERLPPPRPAVEVWIHARQASGIHIRGGRVARGGIRASDRPDDLRAEILGLFRTQMVKNAVIIPVGAKGGFIVKGRSTGAPADADAVRAAYRLFMEALLSITDNLVRGQVVAPPRQLAYDEQDPYLVVAADKGTAALSDVANEVSESAGFWLGDAFASGGRTGYDHKGLGITARGAWECVRQHFRELGRDLETETLTVAGIGDMSGDVFGNGLLLSRHLRLLAAFDHREIFIDPDPDPEISFVERERLFHLPHSKWSDYGQSVLSRGGGVFPRAAKAVALSPEARALLGIDAEAPPGEEIVRAILRLPVDLLWSGGVGTYVKASDETHADASDPTNDANRVDAAAVRAKVVGEGGNLGFTQRARVEYALAGGHIYTDAIDNAGGVDLSDHEVNLKIALQPLVADGSLTVEERTRELAELTDVVCGAVLSGARRRALALTIEQHRSRTQLASFRDLITILESEAGLDRQQVNLPTREMLRARRGVFLGLTKPELAVLSAHAKLDLRRRLSSEPLLAEPELEGFLKRYFPPALVERHTAAVLNHPLRREIVVVELVNELVDTMGMTFLVRAVRDTGWEVADVVRAWVAARAILDADAVVARLTAARERLSSETEQRAVLALAGALERAALWLVQTQPAGMPLAQFVERFRAPVTELLNAGAERLAAERRGAGAEAVAALVAGGLDPELAHRLGALGGAGEALEITDIARTAAVPLPVAAEVYAGVGVLVDLDWVRRAVPGVLPGEDRWEPRAVVSLLDVVAHMRRQLTLQIIGRRREGASIRACLDSHAAACREQLATVNELVSDLKAAAQPTLPALLVLLHEVGRLVRAPSRS